MLQMTPGLIEKFTEQREEDFVDSLTPAAASAFPEYSWFLGPAGFRKLLKNLVRDGKDAGLGYEYTLGRYIYWRLDHEDFLGEGWDTIREILQDQTAAEEERVFAIDALLYGSPLYPERWDHE